MVVEKGKAKDISSLFLHGVSRRRAIRPAMRISLRAALLLSGASEIEE
jgi:lipopolysaccharide export LptBFGC system permease protein LptF